MGNPRSVVPAEIPVFFLQLSGGHAGSSGALVQRGMLCTALTAVRSFLARTHTQSAQSALYFRPF